MAKKKKFDRSAMKEQLKKRMQESQQRAKGGSLGFFKPAEEGVKFWKCDNGEHMIDIIPYFAGPNDPNNKEGEFAHVLEIYAHFAVGADEKKSFICTEATYGRKFKCPICEHRKQLQAEGADDEVIKKLVPKRRCIYNIICYDSSKEEEKGIQVWHVSHYFSENHFNQLMMKPIRAGRQSKPDSNPYIYYMDAEEGKTIAFSKSGEGMTTKFVGHRFLDRDYEIEDDILEQANTLDELIHIPTYEEVYEEYWGEPVDGSDDDDTEEEEEEKPKAKSKSKRVRKETPAPAPEEDEDEDEDDEDEEETEDDSDDSDDSDEEETEDDDEGEECPGFGKDVDKLDDCEDCDLWEECLDEKEKREEEAKKAKKKDAPKAKKRRRS